MALTSRSASIRRWISPTDVIDRIHTTAGSHSRVMCIEIMGNKAGWLTLYAGIAGGADIILIPGAPL